MANSLENSTFIIHTFGCQMNENDSERIAALLIKSGATPSGRLEDSDVIIINTCAVRQKSEEKFFSLLGRLRKMKEQKPLVVGVVGCVAQLYRAELLEKSPVIDFVLGPDNYRRIPKIITDLETNKTVATNWDRTWHEIPLENISRESQFSAYVTIMEGCDNFCTYCVVPFTRGREKFRPLAQILAEVSDLADRGFGEVQLLGQNVNSYRDPDTGAGFPRLLQKINDLHNLRWVRFLTSHPKDFSEDTARAMSKSQKVCQQIHLPLQSGSSSVLKRMNRGYTREEYLERVAMIRAYMPRVSFSTDIIVGFPGEEEKDFQETLDVLDRVRFTNIFSFRYSPRPRTAAARMKDSVPFSVKRRRLMELQDFQKNIQLENNSLLVGKTASVLVTGRSKKNPGAFSGRNEAFQVVNFEAEDEIPGRFVRVLITSYGPYSLRGKVISG